MTISIQPATWRDLPGLRRLEEECFDRDAWPLLDLIAVLTTPGILRLKAVDEGNMVAFVAGDPRSKDGIGWITTICVQENYRRRGIAMQLLEQCEAGMQMPRVRLCVRKSNTGAIQLYLQRGYQHITTWPNYYNGGEEALVLEKIC